MMSDLEALDYWLTREGEAEESGSEADRKQAGAHIMRISNRLGC